MKSRDVNRSIKVRTSMYIIMGFHCMSIEISHSITTQCDIATFSISPGKYIKESYLRILGPNFHKFLQALVMKNSGEVVSLFQGRTF
jgi:hypothetical protein